MTDTSAPESAPRRPTPRRSKKKYPLEALFTVAGAAFFLGALVVWGSVGTMRDEVPQLGARLGAVEEATRQSQKDIETILFQLSDSHSTQAEQEQFFKEQLSAFSTDLSSQQSQITGVLNVTDISRISEEWDPFVYMLSCFFTMDDGKTREDRASAVIEKTTTGVRLLTNRHIIERKDGTLEKCVLSRPDSKNEIDVLPSAFVKNDTADFTYAFLTTEIPAMPFSRRCVSKPHIGDHVLILGYPGIGAKESVTATDGIISGFDAENYTTSAKIEKGNSGGAAIDVGLNCFLGLPTLVVPGVIESLARILPIIGL
jgi:S1-C subfamily serine protease